LFGGERPTTNTSGVCFHDADDLSDATWWNAEASADATNGRGTACHVWIRAIVDVEHERICALNEDALAGS